MLSAAFVCSSVSRITQKNYSADFHKNSAGMRHGPRKNPLDFGGNPDNITLR